MKRFLIITVIPLGLAVLGAVAFYQLFEADVTTEVAQRLPGADSAPARIPAQQSDVRMEGKLVRLDGAASEVGGEWPRFRGPDSDGISRNEKTLAESWPEGGPVLLWSVDLGEGHAGAAVLGGRVYVLDYDRQVRRDVVRCLSLDDGRDIWRYSYPVHVKRNHGMSRTVPAVTNDYVVTLGPKCHVVCLNSVTGEFGWMIDLVAEYGTTVPQWYAGQCPLIDDGQAVIAPGGDALMIKVDCRSGEVVWSSGNPDGWKMTHSSIMPMEFAGRRFYVYCGSRGIVGISSEDGSVVWRSDEWRIRIANIPSPVVVGEGLIFLSGGYNSGSMMLQLEQQGDRIVAEPVFRLEPEVFGSPQHTPIFYQGYIYGVRPDGQLTCLGLDGQVLWTSTSANKFGLGPYTIADGLIYVMDDEGVLRLVKAEAAGYSELARAKVLEGPDSWGPMAIVSGRLIVRDLNRMICLDISEGYGNVR